VNNYHRAKTSSKKQLRMPGRKFDLIIKRASNYPYRVFTVKVYGRNKSLWAKASAFVHRQLERLSDGIRKCFNTLIINQRKWPSVAKLGRGEAAAEITKN
jgi:hypothetical protein